MNKNTLSPLICILFILLTVFSCKKEETEPFVTPDGGKYSEVFTGGEFHLGPVDWVESVWPNAFGPYPSKIRQIEGNYLAGLHLAHNGNGEICDACIKVETEKGKSLVLRVITTGNTTPNSIDVSPEAYAILNSGEYPRHMSWYVTKCPDNGENIYYQFKTGCHEYWVAFWCRNVSLPVSYVEVISSEHAEWYKLKRETDGSYVYGPGFRNKPFKIRVTAIDGTVIEDSYESFTAGGLLESSSQF